MQQGENKNTLRMTRKGTALVTQERMLLKRNKEQTTAKHPLRNSKQSRYFVEVADNVTQSPAECRPKAKSYKMRMKGADPRRQETPWKRMEKMMGRGRFGKFPRNVGYMFPNGRTQKILKKWQKKKRSESWGSKEDPKSFCSVKVDFLQDAEDIQGIENSQSNSKS